MLVRERKLARLEIHDLMLRSHPYLYSHGYMMFYCYFSNLIKYSFPHLMMLIFKEAWRFDKAALAVW